MKKLLFISLILCHSFLHATENKINLYELYKDAHMPWDWHKPLFDFSDSIGLTIFSSPFDNTAVDLLEDLGAPAYKIASFEATDLILLEAVARTGKPIIMSTGGLNETQIAMSLKALRAHSSSTIELLYCVSSYPAKASDFDVSVIARWKEKFQVDVHYHNVSLLHILQYQEDRKKVYLRHQALYY